MIDGLDYGIVGAGRGHLRDSYCVLLHGPVLQLAPASTLWMNVRDVWRADPKTSGDYSKWSCKKNDKLLGDLECPNKKNAAKTPACTIEAARQSACISRYQTESH
jgi:hypothetical protein